MPQELNTQLQQELGVWLLIRITSVLPSCSLLPSPREQRQVPQSAESLLSRVGHVCLLRASMSNHTYHIGFLSPEHQIFAANVQGVSPPANPHPQQHQVCAVQGFVKPFSIN